MLYELFKHNNLEYVDIQADKDRNIILDMTLSNNLKSLRYLYINSNKTRCEITLDVS